jgi:hypothetical protein
MFPQKLLDKELHNPQNEVSVLSPMISTLSQDLRMTTRWKTCALTAAICSSILAGPDLASSTEDWYLVQITDPHVEIYDKEADNLSPGSALSRWTSALQQIAAMDPPPRFAVCTGDLVNFGTGAAGERNFQRAVGVLHGSQTAQEYYLDAELTIPLYICPGNHDGKNSNMLPSSLDNYHRLVKEESYYLVVGDDYAIFSLNSGLDTFNDIHWLLSEGDGLYQEDVQAFLEDLPAVGDSLRKIVILHHPYVNPEGSFIGSPWNDWVDGSFVNYRDEFLRACEDHEVQVVLNGHYDEGRPFKDGGIWNKHGDGWQLGDGPRFVMTNSLQWLNAYRKVHFSAGGQVEVGPVEFFAAAVPWVSYDFRLDQNYPNPFNTATNIRFNSPYFHWVRLEIFNLLGQRVRTLVDRRLPGGEHIVGWDGKDETGGVVAAGVYFSRLEINERVLVGKMVLLR